MACKCNLSIRAKIKLQCLIDLSSIQTILAYRCLGCVYYDFKILFSTTIELIMFILLIINNTSNIINAS